MPALLRNPVTRFITTTALVGSLADWTLFAAMVVMVDGLLGAGPWGTAIVLLARIIPGVVFAPVAARRIDRRDLRTSLLGHEALRAVAVAGLLAAAVAESLAGALVAVVVLEFAAAMQAAGREALISRHAPPALFTGVNTATAVLSFGLLPLGGIVVELVGARTAWLLALAAYAVVIAACAHLRSISLDGDFRRSAAQTARATADVASPSLTPALAHTAAGTVAGTAAGTPAARWRIVVAAALGIMPAVALFSLGPDLAQTWLGDRSATGRLYAFVIAGGAGGFALANARRFRAEVGLLLAATGMATALLGAWPVGLMLLGTGAGAAYLDLQTRLQHAASDPSEFASAFAVLKVSTGLAVIGGPAIAGTSFGLAGVLAAGAGLAAVGAAVATGPALAGWVALGLREGLGVALRILVRVDVAGSQRRVGGGAVIVSNHPHWLDGAVAVQADRSLRPIARWQPSRAARAAIWIGGAVVTTAGTGRDRRPAFEQAAAHLGAGGRIWLAPEGGSHQDFRLRPPRSGAVVMAHAAGVAVQPLAIKWADGLTTGPALRRWRPWRRPTVVVEWGNPITTTGDVASDKDAMMAALSAVSGLPTTARPVAAAPGGIRLGGLVSPVPGRS